MALFGEVVEHGGRCRPGACLGLPAAGQLEFAEQDVAELLRAAEIERLAGERLRLVLKRRRLLGELAGEAREHLAIDRNAAPFHAREHRHERAFERLVDRADALGDEPRLEQPPQAERKVGLLGAIGAGARDFDVLEGNERAALADDVGKRERRMLQMAGRKLGQRMPAEPGIEHIGHELHIVERGKLDVVTLERVQVRFQIVADLEHACALEQRLELRERVADRDLAGHETAAGEQVVAAPGG